MELNGHSPGDSDLEADVTGRGSLLPNPSEALSSDACQPKLDFIHFEEER